MGGILGIVGALGGGLMQANAAKKAGQQQSKQAKNQLALQERMYDEAIARTAPWLDAGNLGLQAGMNMLGLGQAPMIGGTAPQVETYTIPGQYTPSEAGRVAREFGGPDAGTYDRMGGGGGSYGAPTTGYRVNGQEFATLQEAQAYANANRTGGTEWSWQMDPGYQFRMDQGQAALDASAFARGDGYSGAAMQDALEYGQNFASNEWGNIFNRLMGVSGTGLSAASMGQAAGQNYANGASQAYSNLGNAQAAGTIGAGNAWGNALADAYGVWNYQQQMTNPAQQTGGNWLFGGNSWGA